MKTMTKGLVGTVAAGAMALSLASPAAAQQQRERDGIDAGEVIAGALIIGGIAAVIAAATDDDDDRRYRDYDYNRSGYRDYDRRGYRDRNRRGSARNAVDRCVRAAENQASRYTYGRADVTDIRDIDSNRRGFTIKGRIAVNTNDRNWRRGDNRRGRGWDNDYRGYNGSRHRGYDSGRFTCRIRDGRIVDLDFSGIRGL